MQATQVGAGVFMGFIIGLAAYAAWTSGGAAMTSTTTVTTSVTNTLELPVCPLIFYSPYNTFSLWSTAQSNSITIQHLGNDSIPFILYHFENQPWQKMMQSPFGGSFIIPLPSENVFGIQTRNNLSLQVGSLQFIVRIAFPPVNCVPVVNPEFASNVSIDQKSFLSELLKKVAGATHDKSLILGGKLLELFDNMSRILKGMANATLLQQKALFCDKTMTYFTTGLNESRSVGILQTYVTVCNEYKAISSNPHVALSDINMLMMDIIYLDNSIASDP